MNTTYTILYTGNDNQSHFKEEFISTEMKHPLGLYSEKMPASSITFRTFDENLEFPWHNAPQPQYIIYLEGEVEVEIGSGEKRTFKPGDILLATDLHGQGHVSRTITKGRSIIVTR
jgi:quercetin dioxygenase-like cupin family protein